MLLTDQRISFNAKQLSRSFMTIQSFRITWLTIFQQPKHWVVIFEVITVIIRHPGTWCRVIWWISQNRRRLIECMKTKEGISRKPLSAQAATEICQEQKQPATLHKLNFHTKGDKTKRSTIYFNCIEMKFVIRFIEF